MNTLDLNNLERKNAERPVVAQMNLKRLRFSNIRGQVGKRLMGSNIQKKMDASYRTCLNNKLDYGQKNAVLRVATNGTRTMNH